MQVDCSQAEGLTVREAEQNRQAVDARYALQTPVRDWRDNAEAPSRARTLLDFYEHRINIFKAKISTSIVYITKICS